MGAEGHYELIERYLSGEMEEKELVLFEAQMDDQLKKEISLHKDIKSAALETDIMNFREIVKESINEEKSEEIKPQNSRPSLWKVAIAAAVATFIVAMINLILSDPKISNERLYLSYFTPYENLLTVRSSKSNTYAEALGFYEIKEYNKAIELFKEIDRTGTPSISLYYGISLMTENKMDKARMSLQEILKTDNIYKAQANWYLALIDLKQSNIKEAEAAFKLIAVDKSYAIYHKEAQEILDQLAKE